MTERNHCPYCGHENGMGSLFVSSDNPQLATADIQCAKCGEYYSEHFILQYIGASSYGCNLFPAPGEDEHSMLAVGVYQDD